MLKMATTLDARTSIPNGPRWLTGDAARTRVHQLRAESDAIVVGAGTVRADDPELTVRHVEGPSPQRIVLSHGPVSDQAKVHPCTVWSESLDSLLDTLGDEGVLQLMVEGGPSVATSFHNQGLINQYVFHVAPVVSGRADAPGVFIGDVQQDLSHCVVISTTALGDDVEIVLQPLTEKVGAS
jgi:diaminohydroxyphosphoribosylaminopyrimidine deaminase/5-amino-6-(5-phosphoribosylamino)uracil reductase